MATYDPLRDGRDTLMIAAVATLTDAGYTWNQNTTSFSEYLATALTGIGGSTVSNRTMSITQLLAGLVNEIGAGPVSHLTSSFDQLLALLGSATAGPLIELSSATIAEDASVGDDVGAASASGTTGTATWALDDDDGGKYTINGSTGLVEVAAALSAGTDSITISVSGLTPAPDPRTFSIEVTSSFSPSLDFSDDRNSQYVPII